MNFKILTLEDIDKLRPYFVNNQCRICDCTIGGTFIWRDFFRTEYAIADKVLYLKATYLTGDVAFASPRGEPCPEKPAYDTIIDYCHSNGLTPRLCAVSANRLEKVRAIYPDAKVTTERAWSDYLYMADDIKNLAGRKYSGQRNHINRFLREREDWRFEKIDANNLTQTREFFEFYAQQHDKDYPALKECNMKALEVLDNLERYGLFGGILLVEGSVVGGAIGEIVGDTLFVHIEKANTDFKGSYPMLVNQFAKTFAQGEVTRINREEDDGVEGLRISKMSYHPCTLLDKYVVEFE